MSPTAFLWLMPLAAGVSVILLVCLLFRLIADVPPVALPMRDSPPRSWRRAWPLVLVAGHYSAPWLTRRYRRALEKRLAQAGLHPALSAQHLFGMQCLLAIACGSMAVGLLAWGAAASAGLPVAAACGAGCGGLLPRLWLRDRIALRRRQIVRALPFLLDMTTLCVEAGLNFAGALQQAVRKGPAGPLRDELQRVLTDVRTGVPRAQALRDMADRIDEPAVRSLVSTLVQADTLGMNLAQVLRLQSDQRRSERFLRAEKLAMEAPVKLLFPLIAFIFPCTFIVIGFPIAMKLWDLVG